MYFDVFCFLFIFTTINREILFFGLDLRYVLVLFAIVLIVKSVLKKTKLKLLKNEVYLILFYLVLFCSYIFLWGNKNIVYDELRSLTILHINNFLSLVVFILYRKEIKEQKILQIFKFSTIVLMISFLLVLFSVPIPSFLASQERMMSVGAEHINAFGMGFRIAGFAEDANYAFLFLYSQLIILFMQKKHWYDYIILVAIIGCLGLAFSKTQIVMIVPSLLFFVLFIRTKINEMQRRIMISLFVIGIMMLPFIMYKFNFMASMDTLNTRYSLWKNAFSMMAKNYYLPSGVGSFRFYINNVHSGRWIVQTHSTYVQLLSEIGIISLFLFYKIFKINLKSLNNGYFLMVVNYLCFAITYETIYLQYFIFISYIVYVVNYNKNMGNIK